MDKAAKSLPVWSWVKATPGFGAMGLAILVGEAGDVGSYRNPSCLWKRFGLVPFQGKAYSTWAKTGGLSAAQWTEAGYCKVRRSAAYVVADPFVKTAGSYRDIYLARLPVEHAKAIAAGLIPATTGKATAESWARRGLPALEVVKKIGPEHKQAGHMANMAARYMTKRILVDLWCEWKKADGSYVAK